MADDKQRGDVRRSLDQRRDIFTKLHHRDGLGLRDVAFRLGVSLTTLTRWIRAREIPTRTKTEGQIARHQRLREEMDRDTLKIVRLRLKDRLTLDEIARTCGYKNKSTPTKILKSLGLQGTLSALPTWEEWETATRTQQTRKRGTAKDAPPSGETEA